MNRSRKPSGTRALRATVRDRGAIIAVVYKIDRRRNREIAFASVDTNIHPEFDDEGSVTLSLESWNDTETLQVGQVIALHEIRLFRGGWRAAYGCPISLRRQNTESVAHQSPECLLSDMDEGVQQEHLVDMDADPSMPCEGSWQVRAHRRSGVWLLTREGDDLYLNKCRLEFCLSKEQSTTGSVYGEVLLEQLESVPTANSNLLDYLLQNHHLIPDAWGERDEDGEYPRIYFWSTLLQSGGVVYVWCLSRESGQWEKRLTRVNSKFSCSEPALILAEPDLESSEN